jgi:perosamine synthetase
MVEEFEQAFADFTGATYAVAVSSGTAALHAANYALGVRSGDEVIVPAMTFAATANSVVFQGGIPVFTDVDPDTLLVDPELVEKRISTRTRAILAVDYAGQTCDYTRLRQTAALHGIPVIADACHSLGASYKGLPVGSVAEISAFSLHPVKAITTGEGGMITTDNTELAQRMRIFRNHGITSDHNQRRKQQTALYEMVDLGFNYRLTDFQSALGKSQLGKLPGWLKSRRAIAGFYDSAFRTIPGVTPLTNRNSDSHAYHLYVVRLEIDELKCTRDQFLTALRAEGIGANVHYIPVHLHPYYRREFGTRAGMCPVAESAFNRIMTLPIHPSMDMEDADDVVKAVKKVWNAFQR